LLCYFECFLGFLQLSFKFLHSFSRQRLLVFLIGLQLLTFSVIYLLELCKFLVHISFWLFRFLKIFA
jgi:hypothetical protein